TRCLSDWSSDVCSSDLAADERDHADGLRPVGRPLEIGLRLDGVVEILEEEGEPDADDDAAEEGEDGVAQRLGLDRAGRDAGRRRSEERRVGKEWRAAWA